MIFRLSALSESTHTAGYLNLQATIFVWAGIQDASMVEDVEVTQQPAWMTQEGFATQLDSQGTDFPGGGDDSQAASSLSHADFPPEAEVGSPCC